MKKLLFVIFCCLLMAGTLSMQSCSSNAIPTRVKYDVVADTETIVMKGVLSRSLLEKEPSFTWMTENRKYGSADASAVKVFSEKKSLFTLLIFCGTWCHDSQNLLPIFFRLADKSGFPEDRIQLVGVDRNKTAPKNWHQQWKIVNVPTFIVLRDGQEVGRVVEYGNTGNIEKELAAIVAKL
ncbi:MAG: thioredoxin family protein [Bacteroidota bacterium]